MKKNVYLPEFDFIRAFCAIGIIWFHFSKHVEYKKYLFFLSYANGNWGNILVSIFFLISGALLYNNYPSIDNLKRFYRKRWITIFPTFYVAYLFFAMNGVINSGNFFYKNDFFKLLFTIVGMDGYFLYKYSTYYILGEWFLGAIILLYLLYPILIAIIKSFWLRIIGGIILLGTFIILPEIKFFLIEPFRNLISCLVSFSFGIFVSYYKMYDSKYWFISIPFFLIFYYIPLGSTGAWISTQFTGIVLFFILFKLGKYLMKLNVASYVIKFISSISYSIFLLQHYYFMGFESKST